MDRFNYRENSQSIYDNLTGYTYSSFKDIVELLNYQDEKCNQYAEIILKRNKKDGKIDYVMKKHNIDSVEKLDKCLSVGRTW